MDQQRIIEITADGSHTLFVPGMNEHYHSVNGAIQESTHVFINAGLKHSAKSAVRILEIGFGTGLNALLTLAEVYRNRELAVEYYTIEAYPLLPEVTKRLNYSEQLEGLPAGCFSRLHAVPWDQAVQIIPGFILHKMKGDAKTLPFPSAIDLVYFDAFAPEKQPDIWNAELFDKISRQMNPGGILTTYCAKGVVRRMIQAAGFRMERLPGPPGKREMLRGQKERPGNSL